MGKITTPAAARTDRILFDRNQKVRNKKRNRRYAPDRMGEFTMNTLESNETGRNTAAGTVTEPEASTASGKKLRRVHRIGTFTLGCMLIFFGVLFLLRTAGILLSFSTIFRFWPIIFIFLGCEILLSQIGNFVRGGRDDKEVRLCYDKTAVILLILLTFFAMCMAGVQLGFEYTEEWHEGWQHWYGSLSQSANRLAALPALPGIHWFC